MNPLPEGPFGCIYADPPWQTINYSSKGLPQRGKGQHYETMDLEALKALPVGEVAARDCALLMWIIDSHIDQGFALARAWGFEFKSRAFTWRKVKKTIPEEEYEDDTATAMGMGRWTRKESELCFIFTRGRPKRLSGGVREIINAPRREHSRKPDETYDRIESLVGGPYLEMFARTQHPGWSAWGNQTDKFNSTVVSPEDIL